MGLNILMTAMSLDIGGAETHITELSKKLAAMGHNVTVASAGGVYVDELLTCGIRHILIPLNTKRPDALVRSYIKLGALIKKEKFDVVHAHARIPAFVCGLLQKKYKFRFVTTAHGAFEVTPLLRSMSNWGDVTLAVSNDIKRYLINNYGIPHDSIVRTVNGIDTEKFSAEEIPVLNDGHAIKIIHVSRMDREVTLPAHLLIKTAEKLFDDGIPVRLVLVGDGDDFGKIESEASALNSKTGTETVLLLGSRTDIAELLRDADIFAGVSRSALEAMSERKPVILAGAQGYGGIFNRELLELSLDTNFCFRGEKLPTAELLYEDIKTLMKMTQSEISALCEYGRSVVSEYFSLDRMAGDALSVYNRLRPYEPYKYGDIILSGYYGFKNIGDDSLLQAICEKLKTHIPDVKITALSANPKETAKRYGINSINRYDIVKIIRHMKHAKLFINGGGSLLQDSTSTRSLVYYVKLMELAKKNGLRLMVYAEGIGPLNKESNKIRVKNILKKTDIITLRENESLKQIEKMGIDTDGDSVQVTLDPAFNIKPAPWEWTEYICADKGVCVGKNDFAVSVRNWNEADPDYEKKIGDVIVKLKKKYGLSPIFISMQREKDYAICERLAKRCGGAVLDGLSAQELCSLLGRMKFTLAMRLHTLIYSASVGTPVVGLSYDPKIDAMLSSLGSKYMADIRKLCAEDLFLLCENVYLHENEIRQKLTEKVSEKRKISDIDVTFAKELIK